MSTSAFDAGISRAMWEAVERFHALCYFAPQVRSEGASVGLKGFWMNYFATRIAPVGPVGPDVVRSTFFYYGPSRINRAIPDAWTFARPADIIDARYRGMDQALRSVYDGRPSAGTNFDLMAEAAELVVEATSACSPIGRLLHAGWASLEWPDDPHLALWHGCTLMREYRSGNHLLAVCLEGLDGCEAVVSHVAVGGAPKAWIRDEAGWTVEDEAAANARLEGRGWLDSNGRITEAGRAGRARIEARTDELDFEVWESFGAEKGRRLFEILSQLAAALPPDDQLDWTLHYPDDEANS